MLTSPFPNPFARDVVRIQARQGFIDEDRGVRDKALPHGLGRQRVHMILADAAKGRLPAEQVFELPFIFEQLGHFLPGAEFPGHVTRRPQAQITIVQRLLHGVFEVAEHLVDVEMSVHQMPLIG